MELSSDQPASREKLERLVLLNAQPVGVPPAVARCPSNPQLVLRPQGLVVLPWRSGCSHEPQR